VSLDEEADALVLHVIAAPTAEQLEAEIGEAEPEAAEAGAPAAEGAAAPAEAGGGESAGQANGDTDANAS
jgi:hypothetical protein